MKVRDVMTREVVSVAPDAPLKDAVRLMEGRSVSGLPVIDEKGAVVGVVSEADLLLKEVGTGGLTRRRFGWLLGTPARERELARKAEATKVADAMTAPPVVVGPDDSVRAAARTMVDRRVNRLPVVEDGVLVGIVTRADIARMFLRSDEELQRTILEDVVQRTLWTDRAGLKVEVEQGVVRMTGSVDRRSTAEVLTSLVSKFDGVVAVESDLSWGLDDAELQAPERDLVHPGWYGR